MSSRTDDVALLRDANPVPDPDAAVEPALHQATLERVLATPVQAPRAHRVPWRRVVTVRRGALATGVAVAAIAALFVTGEQRSAHQPFAVLPALADELSAKGRILHVRERTVRLGRDGEHRGAVHEEETWTLLDDSTVQRFRIGTGANAEQGAMDHNGSSDYQPKTNTVTILRTPDPDPPTPTEPPVERMARAAASGKIPVVARPVIDGRPTLKIVDDDVAFYIAQDAPVLVRQELRMPGGSVQRTDFVTFEILPATTANRELLKIQAPADADVVTVDPPTPPPGP
jgi:hypothetical protein